mmetsp:Transcript_3923/g.10569  ORF Transcript_3923/g.10569 Transcript_3923/m.10569 type:complete len:226 (-) Transcript_3923:271-948(-)
MAHLSPPMLPAAALYRRAAISVTASASPAARAGAPLLPLAALRTRSGGSGGNNPNCSATPSNAGAGADNKLLHRLWAPRQGISCASPMAGSPMNHMVGASVAMSPLRSPGTRKNQQLPGLTTFAVGNSPAHGGPFWQKSPQGGGGESVASNRTTASGKAKTPAATPHAPWRATRVRFDSPLASSIDIIPYEETYGIHPNKFNFDSVGNMIPPSPCGMNSPFAAGR